MELFGHKLNIRFIIDQDHLIFGAFIYMFAIVLSFMPLIIYTEYKTSMYAIKNGCEQTLIIGKENPVWTNCKCIDKEINK